MITFTLINRNRPKATVLMLVNYQGQKYRMTIGAGIPQKYWSDKKHRAKTTIDYDGTEINATIRRYEDAAIRFLHDCAEKVIVPSEEQFRNAVKSSLSAHLRRNNDLDNKSITQYIKTVYIPRYAQIRSIATVKAYKTLAKTFCNYEERMGNPITFTDVDIDFYNRFRKWFEDEGYSLNYFGSHIKFFKQIVREARDVDKIKTSDGINHRSFIKCQEQGAAIYLTVDELETIRKCELTKESLRDARNIFLIGCYTGLRISDLSKLTKENFIDGTIRLRTVKTGTDLVIPVHPVVQEIVDAGYDFGKRIIEQKVNERIKEVCRIAGITESVTVYQTKGGKSVPVTRDKCDLVCCHTARRSFATNAYKMGVPSIAIMKITGHRLESTFMRYIKITEEENAEIVAKSMFFTQTVKQTVKH